MSDVVNGDLVARWLPPHPGGAVLKTDLFDELVGAGLVPGLFDTFGDVTGIDVSPAVVAAARARYPRLSAEIADVEKALPFPAGAFDAVVSNSTLDHFAASSDIGAALGELHRVLRPGGDLPRHARQPVQPGGRDPQRASPEPPLGEQARAVRGRRDVWPRPPPRPPRADGLRGCRPRPRCSTAHALSSSSAAGSSIGTTARRRGTATYRLFTAFEGLGKLPTRYLTGYFVAALAHKP